jgi:hypothetical protein
LYDLLNVSEPSAVFTLWNHRRRSLHRREFLRVGGLGLAGVTLAYLLRNEAHGCNPGRPKSVIYVVLSGGPSHIDIWVKTLGMVNRTPDC